MLTRQGGAPIEVWGGIECTVNRVGDFYFDQLKLSGHHTRSEDLDKIAELGIKRVRYPVLWERVAPESLDSCDWGWTDDRLARLRDLGIEPIVGLLHHGSGPRYCTLDDPRFPDLFAEFAGMVAERYPWVKSYTPINEPLTTSRFCGLYGHWYPHQSSGQAWCSMLLNQCLGTSLAMRRIRQVRPDAELIQTEDLGKVYSTPRLAYQASFENERRWVSFDLLAGIVNQDHPLWGFLVEACGADRALLERLGAEPCPPDMLGINYYVTSERFLDDRVHRYPARLWGGNGTDVYVDIEAVRVRAAGIAGHAGMIREAWIRYGIPIAITEAHLSCTREEQMRWLVGAWRAAHSANEQGIDCRAVTAWSLLGAFDWASLLTRCEGSYEPGAFDIRRSTAKPTALGRLVRALAEGEEPEGHLLASPGWWESEKRLLYPPFGRARTQAKSGTSSRPLAIAGRGTLGRAFERICELRGLECVLLGRQEMDICDAESVRSTLKRLQPWGLINAAGFVRVDDAELEPEACRSANVLGPTVLAEACRDSAIPFVTFSSDLVFDGKRSSPYLEGHPVAPLSVYGASKAEAERNVAQILPDSLIVRTSAFFGPWDTYNFVHMALEKVARNECLLAANDMTVSPTYVPDLVNAVLDLLIDGEGGIWHLANDGEVTWYQLARLAATLAGLDHGRVEPCSACDLGLAAVRPRYSALGTGRGTCLRGLDSALRACLSELDIRDARKSLAVA